MRLLEAFWAQDAESTTNGRFHVFGGGMESVEVPALPMVAPLLAVVRLEGSLQDAALDHSFAIVSAHGTIFAPLDFKAVCDPHGLKATSTATIIARLNVPVDSPGGYLFRILVDNTEVGTLPIHVALGSNGTDDEEAEWQEIERESLSAEEIDRVASYLRSTGQASA